MLQKQGYPQIKAIYASFFFTPRSKTFNVFGLSVSAAAFGPHRRQNHDASFYESAVFWLQLLGKTSINGWSTKPTKLQLFLAFTTYLTFFFLPCCISAGDFSLPLNFYEGVLIEKPSAHVVFCRAKRMSHADFFFNNNSNQRSELIIKIKFLLQYPKDESYLHD